MAGYEKMKDEEIVACAQAGDQEASEYLLIKYKNFVRTKARSYFLVGADHEDIVQEGMIGLYKAIRDYNADRTGSFGAFAEICVHRQMITAIKMATRQKHIPLNSYISLNKPIYDEDSTRTLIEMIATGHSQDPEELLIGQEEMSRAEKRIIKDLTNLEKQVLSAYMEGLSYEQIAENVNRHVKCVDNALQRIKKKLEISLGLVSPPDESEKERRKEERRKKRKAQKERQKRRETLWQHYKAFKNQVQFQERCELKAQRVRAACRKTAAGENFSFYEIIKTQRVRRMAAENRKR